jgi:hypothetical protein
MTAGGTCSCRPRSILTCSQLSAISSPSTLPTNPNLPRKRTASRGAPERKRQRGQTWHGRSSEHHSQSCERSASARELRRRAGYPKPPPVLTRVGVGEPERLLRPGWPSRGSRGGSSPGGSRRSSLRLLCPEAREPMPQWANRGDPGFLPSLGERAERRPPHLHDATLAAVGESEMLAGCAGERRRVVPATSNGTG